MMKAVRDEVSMYICNLNFRLDGLDLIGHDMSVKDELAIG